MCDFTKYGGPSQEWLKVELSLPKPTVGQSLDELILTTNNGRDAASKKDMEILASEVAIRNHKIPTSDGSSILARSYRPIASPVTERLPIYLTFHGGGFMFGTIDSEDAACSRIIAAGVPCVVLNVNYRHTPEYTYPTAWDDSEDAFEWLHDHLDEVGGDGSQVIVGGISAGAYMTASMTTRRHAPGFKSERPRILGQILMIPCLVQEECYSPLVDRLADPSVSSYKENEFAPILPLTRIRLFNEKLKLPSPIDPNDRRINPGLASGEEVKDLPPTVFGIAGLDPLRDEALLYAKLLAENGVPTDVNLFKGVPHGARRFGDRLSASQHWDDVIANGLRWILSRPKTANEFEIKVKQ